MHNGGAAGEPHVASLEQLNVLRKEAYTVLYDFTAAEDCEMSVRAGDLIIVQDAATAVEMGDEVPPEGWVFARLLPTAPGASDGMASGYVPESYLSPPTLGEAASAPAAPQSTHAAPVASTGAAATTNGQGASGANVAPGTSNADGTASPPKRSRRSRVLQAKLQRAARRAVIAGWLSHGTSPRSATPALPVVPGSMARVMYAFTPETPGELAVVKGEVVTVQKDQRKAPDGWILVQKIDPTAPRGYVKGFIPAKYVSGLEVEGSPGFSPAPGTPSGGNTPRSRRGRQSFSAAATRMVAQFDAALRGGHDTPARPSPVSYQSPPGSGPAAPVQLLAAPAGRHSAGNVPSAPGSGSRGWAHDGHADAMDVFEPTMPSLVYDELPDAPVPPPRSMLAKMYASKFGGVVPVGADALMEAQAQASTSAREDPAHEPWRKQALDALGPDTSSAGGAASGTPASSLPLGRLPTLEEFKLLRKMHHASVEGVPTGDMSRYMPPAAAATAQRFAPKRAAATPESHVSLDWVRSDSSLASRFAAVAQARSGRAAERVAALSAAATQKQAAAEASAAVTVASLTDAAGSSNQGNVEDAELAARVQRIKQRAHLRGFAGAAPQQPASAKPRAALSPSQRERLATMSRSDVESLVGRIQHRAAMIRAGDVTQAMSPLVQGGWPLQAQQSGEQRSQ